MLPPPNRRWRLRLARKSNGSARRRRDTGQAATVGFFCGHRRAVLSRPLISPPDCDRQAGSRFRVRHATGVRTSNHRRKLSGIILRVAGRPGISPLRGRLQPGLIGAMGAEMPGVRTGPRASSEVAQNSQASRAPLTGRRQPVTSGWESPLGSIDPPSPTRLLGRGRPSTAAKIIASCLRLSRRKPLPADRDPNPRQPQRMPVRIGLGSHLVK